MAFSAAVTDVVNIGSRRLAFGTYTNAAADSGGTITTGLKTVQCFISNESSHLGGESPKVTKNSPAAGQVAIVTSDGTDGEWIAIGI